MGQDFWPEKQGDRGGGISAHRHEAGMTEGELAGIAIDQIEADGEDDVDADLGQNIGAVRVDFVGKPAQHTDSQEGAKQECFRPDGWSAGWR